MCYYQPHWRQPSVKATQWFVIYAANIQITIFSHLKHTLSVANYKCIANGFGIRHKILMIGIAMCTVRYDRKEVILTTVCF